MYLLQKCQLTRLITCVCTTAVTGDSTAYVRENTCQPLQATTRNGNGDDNGIITG